MRVFRPKAGPSRTSLFGRLVLAVVATAALAMPSSGRASPADRCAAGALKTSRTLTVGGQDIAVGLKTYPRSLALADHELVLTFDDGPLAGPTTAVLDSLRAECVSATFFLIGRNAAAEPALVRRMLREGHSIGHHSYSHPSITMRGLDDGPAKADIERGFRADDEAAYGHYGGGPVVPFFRFPGFADTASLLAWLGRREVAVFGADIWASDWVAMSPQMELSLLLARIERAGRGIVLLHDTRQQTARMLPDLLTALRMRGFRIVHLVPGPGSTETRPAPAGWTSETEASLRSIMPSLLRRTPALARAPAE